MNEIEYKSFPNHYNKQVTQSYNLYQLDQYGQQTKLFIQQPVISQNCSTLCYIDISQLSSAINTKCPICDQIRSQFCYDFEYKSVLRAFKNKLRNYHPLHIEINPASKKVNIPKIGHNLISAISNDIGNDIYDELGIPSIKNKISYKQIQKDIKAMFDLMAENNTSIYSWCRKWDKTLKDPHLLLFMVGSYFPIKTRVVFKLLKRPVQIEYLEKAFYTNCSVAYLGQLKTFIMCLYISEQKRTLFFAASMDRTFKKQIEQLHFEQFKQEQYCRSNVCSAVNQLTNSVSFFGGFDDFHQTFSSDYMLTISNIKWNQQRFTCEFSKDFKVFLSGVNRNFVSFTSNPYLAQRKDSIRAATSIRYQNFGSVQNKISYIQQVKSTSEFQSKKKWLTIGGLSRMGGTVSGRLVSRGPGIKEIIEDRNQTNVNPVVEYGGQTNNFNFSGLYPLVIDLPITGNQILDKKFMNKVVIFGTAVGCNEAGDAARMQKAFLFDPAYLKCMPVSEKSDRFPTSCTKPQFNDHFWSLLYEKKHYFYLRGTFPCCIQPQSKVPQSKVPQSKVPQSKVPQSKMPQSKMPKVDYYIVQIFLSKSGNVVLKVKEGSLDKSL